MGVEEDLSVEEVVVGGVGEIRGGEVVEMVLVEEGRNQLEGECGLRVMEVVKENVLDRVVIGMRDEAEIEGLFGGK
ncbi:hypothetical protein, partial [Neisseria sicca]|uniref:hypothetical protein n=1 Tax=Neisseria sicca TaxID=490 RepID=UPI0011BD15D9